MAAGEEGQLALIKRPRIKHAFLALVGLALGLFSASRLADHYPDWNAPISSVERYSEASFARWLGEDRQRRSEFAEFEQFLRKHQTSAVVPNWQLLRTDMNDRIGCARPAFLLPPRANWPNILPALRLLKDHVIPAIGPVEVVSSYRTEAFNSCVNGAAQSRHLSFFALDLVATSGLDNRTLFSRLCRLQERLGAVSRFGLGAYFDPARNGRNQQGRFHVDATGFRSWGFSKKAATSGCRLLTKSD